VFVMGTAGCTSQLAGSQTGTTTGTTQETTESSGTTEASTEPLRIGVVQPYSGDLSEFGSPMENGQRLAVKHINAAGGINGRQVELVTEDSGTKPSQGVNAANKLVENQNVSIIIGAVSSSVTISIAKSVTIPNKIMHISAASSSPLITTLKDNDYVWRTRTNDRFSAQAMARVLADKGVQKAAVVHIDNDFGTALADTFEQSFQGTTTAKVGYKKGRSSYRSVLDQAFADNPEWVVYGGYTQSGKTIMKQWKEGGYGGNWMLHSTVMSEDFVTGVGRDVAAGMWGVQPRPPKGDAVDAFNSEYKNTYPDAPLFRPYTSNSYDAIMSYALAAQKAGTADPTKVKVNMRPVSNPPGTTVGYESFQQGKTRIGNGNDINYRGPSGAVDYNDAGETASDMGIFKITASGDPMFKIQRTVPASELVK
ncbi:MAG: ABC transporter substrate-binding protein, partial [Halorhabdus sp.]